VRHDGPGGNVRAFVFDSSLGEERWSTDKELAYSFRDCGGTSTSMTIALHWVEVALASIGKERLSELSESHGFSWKHELPTLEAALSKTFRPVVANGNGLYTIHEGAHPDGFGDIPELGISLSTDNVESMPTFETLTTSQRKLVR